MRFYTNTHNYYCGIDLHAKTMYLCILDQEGKTLLHYPDPSQNMRSRPEDFLAAVEPYRGRSRRRGRMYLHLVMVGGSLPTRRDRVRLRSRPLHEGHPWRQGQERQDRCLQDRHASSRREPPEGLRLSAPRCEPRETCCEGVSISFVDEPTCWPTSRTPTISTISRLQRPRSPTRPTERESPKPFGEPDARKSVEVDFALIEHYDGPAS